MYSEDLKQTLIANPRFSAVYFNEKDDTQYVFHPNANFRKIVSRDEILKGKPAVTENEIDNSKPSKNKNK